MIRHGVVGPVESGAVKPLSSTVQLRRATRSPQGEHREWVRATQPVVFRPSERATICYSVRSRSSTMTAWALKAQHSWQGTFATRRSELVQRPRNPHPTRLQLFPGC